MDAPLKYLLLISTLLGGISFSLGGLHFTVERIFLAIFFAPMVLILFARMLTNNKANNTAYGGGWLIGLWCVVLLISTMLTKNPRAHMNGFAISCAPAILYFFFASSPKNELVVRRTGEWGLWYLSVAGVVLYLIWMLASPSWLAQFIDRDRMKLTLLEPNIYGATVGYFLVLHFPYFRKTKRHYILYAFAIAAVAFSFSRVPYVALMIGAAAYLTLTNYFKSLRAQFLLTMLTMSLALVAMLFSDVLRDVYTSYLYRPDSFSVRMIDFDVAYHRFLLHPILGNGALDFGLHARQILEIMGTTNIRDVWIWQMFLAIAHDTGVVGLAIYIVFLSGLLWHGYYLAVRKKSKEHCAYLAGFLLLLVASQSTTLHLTGLFGVAMGLLGSGATVRQNERNQVPMAARKSRSQLAASLLSRRLSPT